MALIDIDSSTSCMVRRFLSKHHGLPLKTLSLSFLLWNSMRKHCSFRSLKRTQPSSLHICDIVDLKASLFTPLSERTLPMMQSFPLIELFVFPTSVLKCTTVVSSRDKCRFSHCFVKSSSAISPFPLTTKTRSQPVRRSRLSKNSSTKPYSRSREKRERGTPLYYSR
ncbi:hypothetical protein I3842_05G248600 [Carya illinoinensis]|uniref:Uncharacterized protein n=1 Tax=Carya illinoinensis TaxID=32201 RepID=A0A922JNZ4_CARIL|nr:hypothetical protein I3842_05G248600 [Carya illinoinensis]